MKDPSINISAASGNPSFNGAITYIGDVNAHVDVLSFSLVYRWGAPEPAVRPIVSK